MNITKFRPSTAKARRDWGDLMAVIAMRGLLAGLWP